MEASWFVTFPRITSGTNCDARKVLETYLLLPQVFARVNYMLWVEMQVVLQLCGLIQS